MIGHRVGFGRCEFDNLIADHASFAVSVCQQLLVDPFVHGVIANSTNVIAVGGVNHIPEQDFR